MMLKKPFLFLLTWAPATLQVLVDTTGIDENGKLPFGYYDRLLIHNYNETIFVRRSGNVDIVIVNTDDKNASGTETETNIRKEYGRCHLVSHQCFSIKRSGKQMFLGEDPYKDQVATLIAIHHFNTGNGQVVKEIEGIDQRCNIRLTTEQAFDTQCSIVTGVKYLMNMVMRDLHPQTQESDGERSPPYPCAILGASHSSVTQSTATLSGVQGLVQMSHRSLSPNLGTERDRFPLFARVIPGSDASAWVAVYYLAEMTKARHVAVIFVDDAFGDTYQKAFRKAAIQNEPQVMKVQTFPIPLDPSDEEVDFALNLARDTGYHYILCLIWPVQYEHVMTRAFHARIVGPNYFWLFPGGGGLRAFLHGIAYPINSTLDIATRGIGILDARGGHPGYGRYNAFHQSWASLEQEDVVYINSMMPRTKRTTTDHQRKSSSSGNDDSNGSDLDYFMAGTSEYFQGTDPGMTAAFAYDSVIALGLAACRAAVWAGESLSSSLGKDPDDGRDGDTSPNTTSASSVYLNGTDHVRAIINGTEFKGASGVIVMDPELSSRVPTSTFFEIFNVIRTEEKRTRDDANRFGNNGEEENVVAVFYATESTLGVPNENQSDWNVQLKEPFVYADGTTTPPDDLPPHNENRNYLGKLVIVGYLLCAIVLFLSLFFALWTFYHRNVRVVKASQPFFLIMICAGTFVMGSAIIPLSMDDEYHSQEGLDAACMAAPWLVSLGFVTAFSALFSKTWRVNRIFHNPSRFQRIKVTERDVILPFVILFIANVTALICWTVIEPLKFVRSNYPGEDIFGRPVASYGVCRSGDNPARKGSIVPFIIVFGVLDLFAVVLANFQAYQARNIKVEYSESRYIAIIMASLLQVWCIGIPLVKLLWQQPRAFYMIRVFMVFFTCLGIQLFIFFPKLFFLRAYKLERVLKEAAKAAKKSNNRSDTVGTAVTVSGNTSGTGSSSTSSADDGSAGLRIAILSSSIEHSQNKNKNNNTDDATGLRCQRKGRQNVAWTTVGKVERGNG